MYVSMFCMRRSKSSIHELTIAYNKGATAQEFLSYAYILSSFFTLLFSYFHLSSFPASSSASYSFLFPFL
jgi:hypothetical protein